MIVETAKTGVRNLAANPLRSVLSVLGIVFGVATLVATLSIGEGTKRQILSSIEALGTNLVFVLDEPVRSTTEGRTPGLVASDIGYLTEQVQGLAEYVAPEQAEGRRVTFESTDRPWPFWTVGTSAVYDRVTNLAVERGRFLHEKDAREAARVCVVGAKVAERLGATDLLGQRITIDSVLFEVVGVMRAYGGVPGARASAVDATVWIPITVSQAMSSDPMKLDRIVIASRGPRLVDETKNEVRRLLLMRHGAEDFRVETNEELIAKRRDFTVAFQLALGSIAIVSLLVGGVGIMNILLAAVTERVREIGVRKALGATPADILLQFLFESLILTFVGGAVGVGFGRFMALQVAPLLNVYMKQRAYEWQAVTPLYIIMWALVFAIGVGVIFGLYPAYKASKLDPCEALAYE
jgi:ABC-type antimicrobial peptide transport system permease subunit